MKLHTNQRLSTSRRTPVCRRRIRRLLDAFTRATGVLFLPLLVTLSLAQPVTVTPVGEWPGFQRGPAQAVTVAGGYAYVAAGGVYIFDASQVTNLAPVGIYATPDARDVVVIGQHAYVADWETGFQIVDISDPAHPRRVGECSINGWARRLVVRDNYAYVASAPIRDGQSNQGGGLQVIDVSDPTQPRVVGEHTYFNSPCVWCVGSAYDVAVKGNYAFLAEEEAQLIGGEPRGTLAVFDISDPTFPWLVTSFDTSSSGARSVTISGNHAYVGNYNSESGLLILDISNPAAPTRVGGYATFDTVADVVVVGNRTYFAKFPNQSGIEGVEVLDVSDPGNPARLGGLGNVWPNFFGRALAVTDGTLYVAAYSGLWIFDLTNPTQPQLAAEYDTAGGGKEVVVSGDITFVIEGRVGLHTFDLSNPSQPVRIGGFRTTGSPGAVAMHQGRVFLTEQERVLRDAESRVRFQVLDVANPAQPRRLGGCDLGMDTGWPPRLAVLGEHAYVASGSQELHVIDTNDPSNPVPVSRYSSDWSVINVAASQTHVYLIGHREDPSTGQQRRLEVLDVTVPTNPQRIGTYDLPGYAFYLSIVGQQVYSTSGPDGFQVIDVSDPTAPKRLGGCDIEGWATTLTVTGDYALVGSTGFVDSSGGVTTIDLRDPSNPLRVSEWRTTASTSFAPAGSAVWRNHLYVADSYHSLHVFRINGLPEEIRLEVLATTDELRLRWPATASGFALESSTSLGSPTWDPVPGTPQLHGDQYELAAPVDGPARFFRLRKP